MALVYSLQGLLLLLEIVLFHPILWLFFRLLGASRYLVIPLSGGGFFWASKPLDRLTRMLLEAKEIKLALGELDPRFMENPPFLWALEAALKKGATCKISHSRNVHEKTRSIFKLQEQYPHQLELYTTEMYTRPHFFIAENEKREVIVENVHGDTAWWKDERGNLELAYRRNFWVYTFFEGVYAEWLGLRLNREFEQRLASSTKTKYHPGLPNPRLASAWDIVFEGFRMAGEAYVGQTIEFSANAMITWRDSLLKLSEVSVGRVAGKVASVEVKATPMKEQTPKGGELDTAGIEPTEDMGLRFSRRLRQRLLSRRYEDPIVGAIIYKMEKELEQEELVELERLQKEKTEDPNFRSSLS